MPDLDYTVELASWSADEAALRAVREAVFIEEQRVTREEEWDDLDLPSVHVVARDALGTPVGTARLTPEHKIGRMAVLKSWRNRGVGDAMLRTLLEHARSLGHQEVALHAQVDAIPFYERAGFVPEGEEFMEAGIRHRTMRLALPTRESREAAPLRPAPEPRAFLAGTLLEAQEGIDELARAARHRVWIYSRDLDRFLLDREPFLDEMKRIALSGRGAEIRILVQESIAAVRDGHRLLRLAARISTYIHIRTPVIEDDRHYPSAFVLNDAGGYFFRQLGSRFDGEGNTHAPGRHRQLVEYFERVWDRSEEDPDLRRQTV